MESISGQSPIVAMLPGISLPGRRRRRARGALHAREVTWLRRLRARRARHARRRQRARVQRGADAKGVTPRVVRVWNGSGLATVAPKLREALAAFEARVEERLDGAHVATKVRELLRGRTQGHRLGHRATRCGRLFDHSL